MKFCGHCGEENIGEAKFCDVCGKAFEEAPKKYPTINVKASPAILLSVTTGKTFELQPDEEMLIGRGDPSRGLEPQVLLDDAAAMEDGVSRLHAKIICAGNEYFILDLNSTNSTYLNKRKLIPQEHNKLGDGDEIQLGRYLMRLRFV
jgi:pSer/pThr/pTyr-binding forkhead associated (FHA) protein